MDDNENFEDVAEEDLVEIIEVNEYDIHQDASLPTENEYILEDESIVSFTEHEQSVFCCDLSCDDKFAVTGGQDDRAIIWNTNNRQIEFQTSGHKDSIVIAKFNKNSSLVATGDMSGVIFVWDLNGNKLYDFEINGLHWMLWHPVLENVLLAGFKEGWMWNLSKTNPQCKIFQSYGHDNLVAKIFNDGKRISMGYQDGSIRIWDLKETRVVTAITGYQAHTSSVISIDVNSDDTLIATGSTDATVKILHVKSQKILTTIKFDLPEGGTEDSIESLAFGSQNCLIIGSLSGCIQIWNVRTLTKRSEIKLSRGISKLLIDRNNTNIVYLGGLDGIFRAIDLRDFETKIIMEKIVHQDQILDFSISSNSQYVLTCSDDFTCKIFQLN